METTPMLLTRPVTVSAAQPSAPATSLAGEQQRERSALWGAVSDFTLTALHTDTADHFGQWALGRVVEDSWTLIAAAADAPSPALLGTTTPWRDTVCSTVQASPDAVLIADLRRRRHPVQRAAATTWGLRAYIGAPVCAPDGTRLASLCGWSARPTDRAHLDEDRLRARVSQHARFLGVTLSRELARIADQRRADWAEAATGAQRGRLQPRTPHRRWGVQPGREPGKSPKTSTGLVQYDRLTGLVSSEGFGLLLIGEDRRAHPVADPAAVLAVDVSGVGSVATTWGLRRVARTLAGITREVAGDDAVLARTGARQFAVLVAANTPGRAGSPSAGPNAGPGAGGVSALGELSADGRTGQLAERLREQLSVELPRLCTGVGVRTGSTALTQVWASAQAELVALRR